MTLITPTELARRCDITKMAAFKAIESGLIPFILQGKRKMIDLDDPAVIEYMRGDYRQRDAAKKNDSEPSQMLDKKQVKPKPASKSGPRKPAKSVQASELPTLDAHEMKRRSQFADMRKREIQVETLQKKRLPVEFIDGVYIRFMEEFYSHMERHAATYIRDVGKKILESGEITGAHIEEFTEYILRAMHENKIKIDKYIDEYEPRL